MKKTILKSYWTLATFLLITLSISAQEYIPFPTENAEWNVFEDDRWGSINFAVSRITTKYTLDGDTLIQGESYNKVYASTDVDGEDETYQGGIREINQIVYFFKIGADEEKELYNFNIELNEILFLEDGLCDTLGPYCCGVFLKEITNLPLLNGEIRKMYNFVSFIADEEGVIQESGGYYYWIEGIGSSRGLFNPDGDIRNRCITADPGGPWYDLLCYSQNGEEIFSNENFESCFIFTDTDNLQIELNLKVSPNPFSNYLTLDWSTETLEVKEIRLLDINGKLVKIYHSPSTGLVIDASLLESGIYLLQIITEKGMLVRKVIKG